YHRGQGKDLGHWIEFRSQLELAYRFDDRSRLGVSLSHISNASLDDNNPGTESLMLNYAVPFHRLLAQ
ncbi:MAG: acyloxyacyl hydrolase, partial [Alphaproteobacteria bacterium]|nr:acyloxyacyl hydrolase [Alphaproteobacteria bacterium]